jgi:DNA-binding response OmpR family regulator
MSDAVEHGSGRVLVVEDSDALRPLLSIMLNRRGYEVVAVASGQDALETADDSFDLVLLDVGLPDLNGLEVCRRLRAEPATADLAIILITGRDQPGDIHDGLAAGADDFVVKPFEEAELVARLLKVSDKRPIGRIVSRENIAIAAAQ